MCRKIILLSFLMLMSCLAEVQAQESYIIVHVLNPEGVEIASIEGMDPFCAELFDGEDLIGYAPYDAETHNVPIPIAPGAHIIKTVFNGMAKSEYIEIDAGKTKEVTFRFERTEIDIQSLMTTSGSAHVSISGGPNAGEEWPHYDITEGPPGDYFWGNHSRDAVKKIF